MISKKNTALIIWWCEGTKRRRDRRWKNAYNYSVEVINSDPRIIKLFVDYLTEELQVVKAKLKGQIQIHIGDDQHKIETFWIEYLGLSYTQLNKTIIRQSGSRKRNNFGTFKIRLYEKNVYEKLQVQLDELLSFHKVVIY